ncbi:MAG TPA: metallophosphoesterase, partial [Solirubrobacteraceae bacterium]|nr:metallophosphoesterase [Solirubrobacteraceae bacterium]
MRVRRIELLLDRWPRVYDGFRLALVSDLHAGTPHVGVEQVERVAKLVDREAPDLVALLGDYVDDHAAFAETVRPADVARALARIRAPLGLFAVLGNHDWRTSGGGERVRAALREAGIAVLEDEARLLRSGRVPLWVAGLADATERTPDVPAALADVPEDAALIVLSHDPDLFPRVPARAALTVSGHTHGGQVDIPLLRRRVIPSRFGDRYAAGHVEEDGRHLFVTRGVGTSAWPLRF